VGWLALLAAALVVGVLVARPGGGNDRPLDPRSTGPQGARALVLLLEELGADVDTGSRPGDADTAVLLEDRLSDEGRDAALDFVEQGGTLVVADPTSPIAELAGIPSGVPESDCPTALDTVEVLRVAPGPAGDVPAEPGCFDGVVRPEVVGRGNLVLVGTARFFVNDLLDEADNAVLAAALLAPTGAEQVAFLTPEPGSGERRLFDLLGPGVAQAIVQLAIAALVYVLWRARRLGRPVVERQPVRVAGSELVAAVGRLLAGRRQPGESAAALRADARRSLAARLGVPTTTRIDHLAAAVAARTGLDASAVAGTLELRPVVSDEQLVALAAELDQILSLVLQPTGGTRR
jgi:hypothetical protein